MENKMAISRPKKRPSMVTYANEFAIDRLTGEKNIKALFQKIRSVIALVLKDTTIPRNAKEGHMLMLSLAPPYGDPEVFWTNRAGEIIQYYLHTKEQERSRHYFDTEHIPVVIRGLAIDILTKIKIGDSEVPVAMDNLFLKKKDMEIVEGETVPSQNEDDKHLEAVYYVILNLIKHALEHPEDFPESSSLYE